MRWPPTRRRGGRWPRSWGSNHARRCSSWNARSWTKIPPCTLPRAPQAAPRPAAVAVGAPKRIRAGTGAAAAVAALLAGGLAMQPPTRASPQAGPNTVAVIDSNRNTVSAVVTGVGRPGGVAYGAHATWITDT